MESEKQDGAEIGDVGVKRECLRKTGHGMKVKNKMARRYGAAVRIGSRRRWPQECQSMT